VVSVLLLELLVAGLLSEVLEASGLRLGGARLVRTDVGGGGQHEVAWLQVAVARAMVDRGVEHYGSLFGLTRYPRG
jgi:hypothetical protein